MQWSHSCFQKKVAAPERMSSSRRDYKAKSSFHKSSSRSYNRSEQKEPQHEEQSITSFDEFNLKEDLVKGVYAYGFEKPSAIQQKAILPIVKGRDVIAQSQSGTGKTATFCIGALQILDNKQKDTQVLILSPTRELAIQTQKVCMALGNEMNVQAHACVGGKKIGDDIKKLDSGVQVVSGTPGRVIGLNSI